MRISDWSSDVCSSDLGRIINISSGVVTMGRPHYLHYVASKAAVVGMTRAMARELGADGITVNALLPGATFTEIERETVTPAQKTQLLTMQCIKRNGTASSEKTGVGKEGVREGRVR